MIAVYMTVEKNYGFNTAKEACGRESCNRPIRLLRKYGGAWSSSLYATGAVSDQDHDSHDPRPGRRHAVERLVSPKMTIGFVANAIQI